MKKWLISITGLGLMGACIVALVLHASKTEEAPAWTTGPVAAVMQTQPVQETLPPQTTAATQPTQSELRMPDMSQSTATHVFVYDAAGGQLLYTLGDQTQQIAPASLTKLFTAYVALQYLDPETVVTVGPEAGWIAADSSIAAVSEGCRLSVGLIVQGMLMQSGNDAAYAIAVAAGRAITGNDAMEPGPAYEVFIQEMNAQARALGLTGTHFANPDGYDAEGHYTTAEDLLQITLLAMEEPLIAASCATETAVVTYESGEEYTWKNTNWLLHRDSECYCPEARGLKTGSTSQAGACLIAVFDTGEKELIIGVLGCEEIPQRFADALTLFEHYK